MALGKFEGCADTQLAEYLYNITMESGQDKEAGDVQDYGCWYGLILNVSGIGKFKSYIVTEDGQGFFDYEEFDTVGQALKKWTDIEADYNEWEAEYMEANK